MARAEVALVVAVGALLAFVGVQIAQAPRPATVPEPQTAAAVRLSGGVRMRRAHGGAPVDTIVQRRPMTESAATMNPPPVRDLADIRMRLALGAPGTYIGDMLAEDDSILVRWPDRRLDGLRVWVQPASSIDGWREQDPDMARGVFGEWQTTGLPLRFDFVLDSASASVRVVWIDRFPPEAGQRIGRTDRGRDGNGWIVSANIVVALHDSAGRPFAPNELAGIVRHEVGHALGLDHSKDRATMMYPESTVHEIAAADRATLRLLYTLPPGPVK